MGTENELKCLALYYQKVLWKQLYESRLESGLRLCMCTLKSCQCILQTALDLGRTAQFTKKEQPAQRDTAQSQKATDSLRWDSNASIPHFCFQKIKNKKKSCFSTEKAKGGRLPGVPGQLELFISKQTNTHTLFQRKKKKRERERER